MGDATLYRRPSWERKRTGPVLPVPRLGNVAACIQPGLRPVPPNPRRKCKLEEAATLQPRTLFSGVGLEMCPSTALVERTQEVALLDKISDQQEQIKELLMTGLSLGLTPAAGSPGEAWRGPDGGAATHPVPQQSPRVATPVHGEALDQSCRRHGSPAPVRSASAAWRSPTFSHRPLFLLHLGGPGLPGQPFDTPPSPGHPVSPFLRLL